MKETMVHIILPKKIKLFLVKEKERKNKGGNNFVRLIFWLA